MNEALEHLSTMSAKFSELVDIMKRPTAQGLPDLIQWVERNGKDMEYDFDDLTNMLSHHMEQVNIHGQLHLNHDYKEAAGL